MDFRFFIAETNSDYHRIMWSDALGCDNVFFYSKPFTIKNKILKILNSLHYDKGLNRICKLPWKNIWNKYYSIETSRFLNEGKNVVIFTDISLLKYEQKYLETLKCKHCAALCLYLANPYDEMPGTVQRKIAIFDFVFTKNKEDLIDEKFHFYEADIYSKHAIDIVKQKESTNTQASQSDIFFVGAAKNRLKTIHGLFEKIKGKTASIFYITVVTAAEMLYPREIYYNKKINYADVLLKVSQTNCILEVVQSGQTGPTLRLLEALSFNKKLLTNNLSVKKMPYYNPEYIYVFTEENDIDMAFITEKIPVNYDYKYEYSPLNFLKKLQELIESS